MSPRAIENRLKLVGELTKACLLIRQNSLRKEENENEIKESLTLSSNRSEKTQKLSDCRFDELP